MKIQNFIIYLNYINFRHSRTSRKYKNETFRFKFGKCFRNRTLVAKLLPENMPEEIKWLILH